MPDFLLELFSEEIPARMQPGGAAQLRQRFEALLADAGIDAGAIESHATPRRLALMARGLPAETPASSEERRGPRTDAPAAAVAGFLKSTGLARNQLEERDTDKGRFLFATIDRPGRPAGALLAERLPAMIAGFDWPKSMRWEGSGFRWVRPLRGIVALLNGEVVPFAVAGLAAGRETRGHRFMGGEASVAIESPATYAAQLRAAKVVLDPAERVAMIREGAARAAEAAGLTLVPDAGLEAENAGLTEWPVPLLGRFDPAFLDVPREIIQLTMRTNQKYFALVDGEGALAPAFVCVANLEAPDGGATIVSGNERVLSARLADARFFWEQDKAKPLEAHSEKLKDILFHEKLGTMAEKVERVAKLARWLVETYSDQFSGATPEKAERAARLAKADLTTATVGEFPELQGIIGGHLAERRGEPPGIVEALRQHYAPLPDGCLPVAVALADRLDTLISFFGAGLRPTGSKDPFALRRAGLGVVAMVRASRLKLRTRFVLEQCIAPRPRQLGAVQSALIDDVALFLEERLLNQLRDEGLAADISLAARAAEIGEPGRLWRLEARSQALAPFIESEDGANLLAGYRRAANILRIEEAKDGPHDGPVNPALLTDPAERALDGALTQAQHQVAAAVQDEDFASAMAALAAVRPVVDAFFERLKVNADDSAVRANRLALLAKLRQTAHLVADFSMIQGTADV
jgi:glycyl-tRNA synthetase beta chain